jgi:translin
MTLEDDIENISLHLSRKQKDFDKVMELSRDIIRDAGQTITFLHNNDRAAAKKRLSEMTRRANELMKTDSDFKYHTQQAYQEYVEALAFYQIKTGKRLPSVEQAGVVPESYLLGLMDVVGELKREVLEALRKNDVKSAEQYFEMMENIYDTTRRLRFAEAVLSGFRKKQDVARIQIENAGSEILMFKGRRK